MDCIVIAGGRPAESEPLYAITKGAPKALLKFGERTMVDYVVSALRASQYIDRIVVVGLSSDEGISHHRSLITLPDQGGLISNGIAGLSWLAENQNDSEHILMCSSDIPAITTPIIDEFIEECLPFDFAVYYSLVTREVMENRFPNSKRTFVKLRDIEVAGGDVFIAIPGLAQSHRQLLEDLAAGRKRAWRLARIVGPVTLLKLLIGRLTVKDIELKATNYIGHPVRVVIFPHAEIAMDVDKPHHIEILGSDISNSGFGH